MASEKTGRLRTEIAGRPSARPDFSVVQKSDIDFILQLVSWLHGVATPFF